MNAETINPFITATIHVFSTMTGVEAKKGTIYIKQDDKMVHDISGVVGIAGKMSGFIALSFPESLALKIVSGFLGEETTEMSQDVVDAIGEFVNMIAGSAKRVFAEQGQKYNIGIPNVITGRGHMINRPSNVVCVGVTFEAEGETFVVEVALKEVPDAE